MSMTLSGNGTITGLVAGGLPDATITSAELASNAVDSQTLTLLHASGSAPVYACRAWVNFNGTGTVAIRASGNVSSVTDLGTGIFRLNFSTAMPDTNYAVTGNGGTGDPNATQYVMEYWGGAAPTTSNVSVNYGITGSSADDPSIAGIAVFR